MGIRRDPAPRKKIEQDCGRTQAAARTDAFRYTSRWAGEKAEEVAAAEPKVAESRGAASAMLSAKPLAANDPLINQVIEAMRRMSPEDAARLVTISKALIGEGRVEESAIDLKPLPKPDLAPHPPPAFPPRRLPGDRTKVRGKAAVGR